MRLPQATSQVYTTDLMSMKTYTMDMQMQHRGKEPRKSEVNLEMGEISPAWLMSNQIARL